MIRVCAWCKKVIGQKPPFEDKSETHGMCESCFSKVERGDSNEQVDKDNS